MKRESITFASIFFRFWWTILLVLLFYGVYLHGVHKKQVLLTQLNHQRVLLEDKLQVVVADREDLLMQLESQNDPAWIEMLLKKHLGMVPFGQTKVYFENQ